MPSLDTLVDDIYALFDPDKAHVCNEENLETFATNLKNILRQRLSGRDDTREYSLRFSMLGKPDRQVWYDAHPDGTAEPLTAKTYYKFLYGDVIEQLVLFLASEAGHSVENPQMEIEVNGVKGHIDAIIDGTVVDVKSASPIGFKKFQNGDVIKDDPFGYVQQLSGYASVLTPGKDAAWLAVDKVSGDVCVSYLSSDIIKTFSPEKRIAELQAVVVQDAEPDRCYEDVEDGKSGNRKLSTPCSYCAHKFRCWPGLKAYYYSNGPRFLTVVKREPNVEGFPG